MDWVPTLGDQPGPVYAGIVEALSGDIASGRLHRGQRLPTHRALAKALGVPLLYKGEDFAKTDIVSALG